MLLTDTATYWRERDAAGICVGCGIHLCSQAGMSPAAQTEMYLLYTIFVLLIPARNDCLNTGA